MLSSKSLRFASVALPASAATALSCGTVTPYRHAPPDRTRVRNRTVDSARRAALRLPTLLSIVVTLSLVSGLGCAWWERRANDWVCPDHTLSCTCLDPKRQIGCQEPTNPNDPMLFDPMPSPIGAKPDAGADGHARGDSENDQ